MISPAQTFNQKDQYISKGRSALIYFFNQSHKYGLEMPFENFVKIVGGKFPNIFLENFGWTIQSLTLDDQLTESKLRDAMEDLADRAQGKIPASNTMFFQALSDKIQNYSFVDIASFTVTESAKDLAMGIKDVGDGVTTVFKSFKSIGPLMIVAAVIYIFYKRVKRAA